MLASEKVTSHPLIRALSAAASALVSVALTLLGRGVQTMRGGGSSGDVQTEDNAWSHTEAVAPGTSGQNPGGSRQQPRCRKDRLEPGGCELMGCDLEQACPGPVGKEGRRCQARKQEQSPILDSQRAVRQEAQHRVPKQCGLQALSSEILSKIHKTESSQNTLLG